MKRQRVTHIIHHSLKEIGVLCSAVGEDFEKEAIHKFRVAVKALRSFLRLHRMHSGNKKLKLTKKFKRLYDIAGTIRETQLELQFLQHKPELPHYLEELNKKKQAAQDEWKLHYSPRVVERLYKKLMKLKYKKVPPEAFEHFFKNRTEHIFQLARNTAPTDIDIHDTRKKIKDILYTSKMAGKGGKTKGTESKTAKELNTLSDLIGDYNDERIILSHIKTIAPGELEQQEKSNLKHIKDSEAKKLRKKKEAVMAATRSYKPEQ